VIHLALGVAAVSLTCVFLVVLSALSPHARPLDGLFVVGTVIALPLSAVMVAYVRAQRL
jgi:hypothetical protein